MTIKLEILTENAEANCKPGNTFKQKKQEIYDANPF